MTAAKATSRLQIICVLLCCAGASWADTKHIKLEVPFRRPGLGIGGGAYTGIVMDVENDRRVNTCALVNAVSSLSAGFVQMPDDGLVAKQAYKTDYAKVSPELLTEYNLQNVDMHLQAGPLYGVAYEVSYEVKKGYLLYQVKSKLYYAGRDSSQWYEYSKKYNDTYFSKKLLSAIEAQVGSCAKK